MDLIIKNAYIVDGTGAPGYHGDIGISGDTIEAIGQLEAGNVPQLDAAGRLVIPGIFDAHSHDELGIFRPDVAHSRIVQGITFNIVGQCGASPTPVCMERRDDLRNLYFEHSGGVRYDWNWTETHEYIDAVNAQKPSYNMLYLVGHNTLRMYVMGVEDRKPTEAELEAMKGLLERSLQEGAAGLSLCLNNVPGKFSDVDEIAALAEVVKKYDGVICAHRRGEASNAEEAIEEMIEVTRRTGVRMVCSHVKIIGFANKGKAVKVLRMIEQARAEGLDIRFDAYPYIEGFVQLFQIFPRWFWGMGADKVMENVADPETCDKVVKEMQDDPYHDCYYCASAGAKGIRVKQCPDPKFDNKTLQQISEETGEDPIRMALHIIRTYGPKVMMLCDLQDREENILIETHPKCSVSSDGAPNQLKSHPRYLGSFAKILDYYVKQTGLLTLETAVHKMTGLTAECYKIKDRGVLRAGNKADLVIIDWENFQDGTTFDNPSGLATGINYVFLNGKIAARDGVYTGEGVGGIIRGYELN